MLTRIVEVRRLMALAVAAAAGAWGLHAYPVGSDDVFLALIQIRKPVVFSVFAYGTPLCGSPRRSSWRHS